MIVELNKSIMSGRMKLLSTAYGITKNHASLNMGITPFNRILVRSKYSTPINTILLFVPQQEAWIVERMGKFHRMLSPGLNVLVPIIDRIKYVQSLKEIAIEVPRLSAVTSDNVVVGLDGVLYLKVNDPYLASYGVEDPEFAIVQLAQTTMRSELGKISLDKLFRERDGLNMFIVENINKASTAWGISCLRYEIRDIKLPEKVQEAMQMQVEAERKKRATILESEGIKEADINVATGKRLARILASEAEREEQINKANGEATAMLTVAEARAKSLQVVGDSLRGIEGKNAAAFKIAEQYVRAFDKLAKTNNTMILPGNVGDVSSFVAQAMGIYKQVMQVPEQKLEPPVNEIEAGIHNNTDEALEYFSDKEEAAKYRHKKPKSRKVM